MRDNERNINSNLPQQQKTGGLVPGCTVYVANIRTNIFLYIYLFLSGRATRRLLYDQKAHLKTLHSLHGGLAHAWKRTVVKNIQHEIHRRLQM